MIWLFTIGLFAYIIYEVLNEREKKRLNQLIKSSRGPYHYRSNGKFYYQTDFRYKLINHSDDVKFYNLAFDRIVFTGLLLFSS